MELINQTEQTDTYKCEVCGLQESGPTGFDAMCPNKCDQKIVLEKMTLVIQEFHGEDSSYEDDNGSEHYTLEGKNTISHIECENFNVLKKRLAEIMDSNADNAPYDSYEFVCAYWTESKEAIDERQIEEVDE